MAEETKVFDVVFTGAGRMTGKMRNDVSVNFETMDETFALATDEGAFHGADGTASPPLALFAAVLTGCVMTQLRAFSKRMKIPIDAVEVNARLHWQGEQQGRDPYVTAPVGFDLDIDLKSDAPEADQRRLLDAAKKGCFIEQTLAKGLTVGHRLKTETGWQDA